MPNRSTTPPGTELARTGIAGLDDVLRGGFTTDRLYLVEGVPGSGKTTLGLQFLHEGVRQGEPVLYVTLSETTEELTAVAASHGWTLDGVEVHEMAPPEHTLDMDEQYTLFHPTEVELGQATEGILDEVERIRPTRVVFDSLSEMRLLAGTALRYRRQILALKRYFAGRGCTVLLLDDMTSTERDLQVQSIAHGVISLDHLHPEYGTERRRLRVVKYRGVAFRGGFHDYRIRTGGLDVFPRLVAAEHRGGSFGEVLSSGVPEFDRLLGGGIDFGTSTLLAGPPGSGKSSLAAQFVSAHTARGGRAAMFVFDEGAPTMLARARSLGMDLDTPLESGQLLLQQVDPAELSPGEFAHRIRHAVEADKVTLLVIDSLNGYLNAMPGEDYLTIQLHELLAYLAQSGVATVLIAAHKGLVGGAMSSAVDASYLADGVVLLRYFEAAGEVRQALSVIKKRSGQHERTVREFRLTGGRIDVGPPLRQFRGVLTGTPSYRGTEDELMASPSP